MNLLIACVDSLRLDHVGRTGRRVHAPRFDAVTSDFGFCGTCFSVSSATRPVHTTLFTGLYPCEHGVVGQRTLGTRVGAPHLFDLFAARGYRVGGFSEASQVFHGLPFAPSVLQLPAEPPDGLQVLDGWLRQASGAATFLFVHYWGAHTPYGARDGLAGGETARLLAAGDLARVQQRYARAVEAVLETRLAPLLERVDPRRWAVFVLSDHGQSWTPWEPYHGQTLRNSVLRVPLYYHVPASGNPPLAGPLVSLVDLFPTWTALFALPPVPAGLGRPTWAAERPPCYLAEIDPVPPVGRQPESLPLVGPPRGGRQWAVFDAERKLTWYLDQDYGRLEHTLTEEPVEEPETVARYRQARADLLRLSAYPPEPPPAAAVADARALEERLRALGYLD
ncbi:MAG: sulfatase-like hydrolase/transferase [Candidatus Latescibacterota bacterium]